MGGGFSGGYPRQPAADYANVGVQMFDGAFTRGNLVHVDPAQPRDVPHHVLEYRPQPARLVKTLVIKSDRQKAVQLVEHIQDIEGQARPGILMADDLALPGRLDAGPHIGLAVHLHEAVGAITGEAQEPARAMIFEAAREDAHPGGVEGGGDALAGQGGDVAAVKGDRQRLLRIDQTAGRKGTSACFTHLSAHPASAFASPHWCGHHAPPPATTRTPADGASVPPAGRGDYAAQSPPDLHGGTRRHRAAHNWGKPKGRTWQFPRFLLVILDCPPEARR